MYARGIWQRWTRASVDGLFGTMVAIGLTLALRNERGDKVYIYSWRARSLNLKLSRCLKKSLGAILRFSFLCFS